MYAPEMTVRIEISQTDVDTLREWHVVLGGSQRGGLSMRHGYMPTHGPLLADAVEAIAGDVKELLEAYASGLGGLELHLDDMS